MPQTTFSPDWLNQFASDPYAVLGLSVAADERRILKRYHAIAKLLHPDSYAADPTLRDLAEQLLKRLINPAYHQLKQEKVRSEVVALLRLRARSLSPEEALLPKSDIAQQLVRVSAQEVDVFYEQAIANLADSQLQPIGQFEYITQQLTELNLLYLHLKSGELPFREKRSGIVSATQAKPAQFTPSPTETAHVAVNYAQKHYRRAQEYAKKGVWAQVVVELRDAIRLEPDRSEYHSLLATAYLMQNLTGMAKVHFRQALKFNPNDPLALRYAARLNLTPPPSVPPTRGLSSQPMNRSMPKGSGGGLFGLFAKRK